MMEIATGAVAALAVLLIYWKFRRDYVVFTDEICRQLDYLIDEGKTGTFDSNEETLPSKVASKLEQLLTVTNHARQENRVQKEQVQKIVSDISHQLKTPIANITMYYDTIRNHDLPKEKERECLDVMQNQIEKLEFLVTSLVKMSRLEQELIVLKPKVTDLRDCLLEAMQEVAVKAGNKQLQVSVLCENMEPVWCDSKWTTEAIGNILDNAVKYTPEGGSVTVSTERLGMFTKVMITDTGIGIAPEHVNDIFKRFYRESGVSGKEGVGIGLYLSREIIKRQGGYIKVRSAKEEGSTFSVYLLTAR